MSAVLNIRELVKVGSTLLPSALQRLSQVSDVTGESTDAPLCSYSQNILKNKRPEHRSYRQERNY
jgi:hypothetical protein